MLNSVGLDQSWRVSPLQASARDRALGTEFVGRRRAGRQSPRGAKGEPRADASPARSPVRANARAAVARGVDPATVFEANAKRAEVRMERVEAARAAQALEKARLATETPLSEDAVNAVHTEEAFVVFPEEPAEPRKPTIVSFTAIDTATSGIAAFMAALVVIQGKEVQY